MAQRCRFVSRHFVFRLGKCLACIWLSASAIVNSRVMMISYVNANGTGYSHKSLCRAFSILESGVSCPYPHTGEQTSMLMCVPHTDVQSPTLTCGVTGMPCLRHCDFLYVTTC